MAYRVACDYMVQYVHQWVDRVHVESLADRQKLFSFWARDGSIDFVATGEHEIEDHLQKPPHNPSKQAPIVVASMTAIHTRAVRRLATKAPSAVWFVLCRVIRRFSADRSSSPYSSSSSG